MSEIKPELQLLLLGDLEGPLTPERLFGRTGSMELEIGAGRGDFLVQYAAANPDKLIVAIERKPVYLRRGLSKVRQAGLTNVAHISADAMYLMQNYFLPSALEAIHLYFPDPWPKRRHAKRRLFSPQMLDLTERVLAPGGFLHLRTDVESYFQHMVTVMAERPRFVQIEPPVDVQQHLTGFEARFLKQNLHIYRASYRMS